MKVENLSDLSKLLDLCRKKGVTHLSVDGVSFELSERDPSPKRSKADASSEASDPSNPNWADLSPEEQMFYSAGGMPLQPSNE